MSERKDAASGAGRAAVPGIAVLVFEERAPREARATALLALGAEDERRCRWHAPDVASLQLGTGDTLARARDGLAAAQALPGVIRATIRAAGLALRGGERGEAAVVLPGGVRLGGGAPQVIAGPCSVESEQQICEIAALVKEAGAVALRGGAFKPRTSPYAFGGLGERGLELLALARERTGLPVVTEARDVAELALVAKHADVIQVGSRNMHASSLLFEIGRHPAGKPVLLKRGFSATIFELLDAAEYVLVGRLAAGHERPGLLLCERGIRTFEPSTRFTLDVAAVPILQERTDLPVLVDPSHPAGLSRYVPPLARAAVAAGADGLLIEVHPDPDRAFSDGAQTLGPAAFRELMRGLPALVPPGR